MRKTWSSAEIANCLDTSLCVVGANIDDATMRQAKLRTILLGPLTPLHIYS
jgi:hypothetical protein